MIKGQMGDFNDDIDWGVYNNQQNPSSSVKNISQQSSNTQDDNFHQDQPLGKIPHDENGMVDTFLGKIQRRPKEFKPGSPENKELINNMIDMSGLEGINEVGKSFIPIVKSASSKVSKYMQPGKSAEEFRNTLGSGTSSENISDLSQRAQFAKSSRQQEALIPKEKLYEREGGSNVYDVNNEKLPEGNLPKMANMIAPGEKFGEDEAKALSNAIAKYRKTGKIEDFMDKSEDIFNIPELSEKAASKVEDALSMPTERNSKYFADKNVTDAYSPKGKLMELHDAYKNKPILNNYDALQSAIKKELRAMKGRAKISDTAQNKVDQLELNIKNINSDKEAFMETLPENMQGLENEFRNKYQSYAQTYEKGPKETGASLTLRRLAEGRHDLVTDAAVVKLFSRPTVADKAAILDMGEGAARNAIYAAIQKVPIGDAEKMASTILDLKRTKGFDAIINPEMEQWANNMLKHVGKVSAIKKGLTAAGGAAAGSVMFGPIGGVIGATAPFTGKYAAKGAKYLAEKLGK